MLRTLLEAEIASRDECNMHMRIKRAGLQVTKTLEDFKVACLRFHRGPGLNRPELSVQQRER